MGFLTSGGKWWDSTGSVGCAKLDWNGATHLLIPSGVTGVRKRPPTWNDKEIKSYRINQKAGPSSCLQRPSTQGVRHGKGWSKKLPGSMLPLDERSVGEGAFSRRCPKGLSLVPMQVRGSNLMFQSHAFKLPKIRGLSALEILFRKSTSKARR